MSAFIDNLVKTRDVETENDNDVETKASDKDVLDEDLSERNFYIELSKPGLFFVVRKNF